MRFECEHHRGDGMQILEIFRGKLVWRNFEAKSIAYELQHFHHAQRREHAPFEERSGRREIGSVAIEQLTFDIRFHLTKNVFVGHAAYSGFEVPRASALSAPRSTLPFRVRGNSGIGRSSSMI